jgi:hypothetical protein
MPDAQRFALPPLSTGFGAEDLKPLLPVTLTHQTHSINGSGLLDTGSSVNVLLHHIGLALGTTIRGL